MALVFCCTDILPYKPSKVDHELKFTSFLEWGNFPRRSSPYDPTDGSNRRNSTLDSKWPYAIQLVQQVNYGALESKRYFVPQEQLGSHRVFDEILEKDLIDANFAKVNSYKNFKCNTHNKFFELNLYEKDPINKHHWRVNIARPADDIDLVTKRGDPRSESRNTQEAGTDIPQPATAASIRPTNTVLEQRAAVLTADGATSSPPSTSVIPIAMPDKYASSKTPLSDADQAHFSGDSDNDFDYYGGGYDSEKSEEAKDFTACSIECGYCGHCDY